MIKNEQNQHVDSPEKNLMLNQLHGMTIVTPAMRQALEEIEDFCTYYKSTDQPAAFLLSGSSKSGMTHTTRLCFNRINSGHNGKQTPSTSAYLKVPQYHAVHSMLDTTLYEVINRANARPFRAKCYLFEKILQEKNTKYLFIDNVENAIDQNICQSSTNLKLIANIIDIVKLPTVLIARKEFIPDIIACGPLSQYVLQHHRMGKFNWSNYSDRKQFHRLLHEVNRALPDPLQIDLTGGNTPESFYYATNGLIGRVMQLVKLAARMAVKSNSVLITTDTLAQAYSKMFQNLDCLNNPFKNGCQNSRINQKKLPKQRKGPTDISDRLSPM